MIVVGMDGVDAALTNIGYLQLAVTGISG